MRLALSSYISFPFASQGNENGRAAVLERYDSHVAHCSACSGALATARRTKRAADLGTALALLVAGAVARARAGALLLAALGVLTSQLCAALEGMMTVGVYPPPRNA